MTSAEQQRRDYGEWVFGLAEVAAAKNPTVPLETIWRPCCRAVEVVRPDLERTANIERLWLAVIEWVYPRLKKAGAA